MGAVLVKDLKRSAVLGILFAAMIFVFTRIIPSDQEFYTSTYAVLSVIRLNAMMVVMVVYGTMMHIEKHEAKYRGYELMRILPVTAREIATAKFAVYGLWCVFTSVVSSLIVPVLFPAITDRALLRSQLLSMSMISLASTGVVYACIARFGYRTMKVWVTVIYMALLMGPTLSSFIIQVRRGEEGMQAMVAASQRIPTTVVVAVPLLICIGAWIIASKEMPKGEGV